MKERDLKERGFYGSFRTGHLGQGSMSVRHPRSTQPGTAEGRKKAHWVTVIKTCQPQQPPDTHSGAAAEAAGSWGSRSPPTESRSRSGRAGGGGGRPAAQR